MSRAFVKEDADGSAGEIADLPQSTHPNYVTPRGLAQLRERFAAAQARRRELLGEGGGNELALANVARDIRYLEARLERAIPVDPAAQPRDEVAFGATVRVADDTGAEREFAIVGEDEADAEQGIVSWVSPLAKALIGAAIGDEIVWRRPAGDIALEVLDIRYE